MAVTRYQKQQAARRSTRDIARLQQTFQRAVEDFNAQTGQQMKEFESQVANYNAAYGTYEQRFKDYETRVNQYNQTVNSYNARALAFQQRANEFNRKLDAYNTLTRISGEREIGQLYGKDYMYLPAGGMLPSNLRPAVTFVGDFGFRLNPGYEYVELDFNRGGTYGYIAKRGGPDPGEFTEKFTEQAPADFTEPAPEAPAEPTAPDLTAAKAKLNEERAIMEREINERSKARLRAVQRGQQRPMLSTGANLQPAGGEG